MKAGWEVKPLGDVCEVQNGGTPKSNVAEYWGGDVPWLTPKDMGKQASEQIGDTPRKITELGLSKCSAKRVPVGSVIMSTRAPIGHLSINTVPMAFNQGCRGLTPSENVDLRYLFYFLGSSVEELQELGTGATFKELSAGALKSYQVPIPPLEEQKRIVAVLDAAFEGLTRAKENAETNLQNARELFEKSLTELMSPNSFSGDYREMAIEDVAKFSGGGTPSKSKAQYWGGDIPWVSPKDMKFDLITESQQYVTTAGVENSSVQWVEKGAVLVVVRSGILAHSLPVAVAGARLTVNQDIKVLSPYDFIESHYLFSYLTAFKEFFLKSVSQGATVHRLETAVLKSAKIAVPSIEQQRDIIKKVEKLTEDSRGLMADYTTKLTDIADLRQSLLQKAFAGELT